MDNESWHREVAAVARRQHGVITFEQVLAEAPSLSAARHELGRPHWERATGAVHRIAGAPETDHQKVMIAVVGAGAGTVASHRTAAAMWGIRGEAMMPIHVTRLRDSNTLRPPATIVHQARYMAADQITVLDGIPITRPERVPFDLANIGLPAARIERIVDRLWSDRLVSSRSLRRVKHSLPLRGFRGTALMRKILEARGEDWVPPASGLESRLMELLDRNGFDGYERQVDLGGDEWVGRVDFVHRGRHIVIEVQSDRHHAALSSRRDDVRRLGRLAAAGFTVVTVWEDELWYRPGPFLGRLRRCEQRSRPHPAR